MATITATNLKLQISKVLKKQGYNIKDGNFFLRHEDLQSKRGAHRFAKAERIADHTDFIIRESKLVSKYLVDGKDIDITKIKPKIIEVKPETEWEKIFRWWNLVWWSLPYEHAYGRQMRFIVWDEYHNAPIGLIGLQSPILSWSVRDNELGIKPEDRDFWVNQSLSAQRLGALPPYNYLLGGKLVAYLMTTDAVRKKFTEKYKDQKTLLKNRKLPAQLLFITTTGAYGKSSVYTRLKFKDEWVAKFIGYSQGSGTFHIPNTLYEDLVKYLGKKDIAIGRSYGNGPSRKLRLIDQALQMLGFKNGANHGVKRAVYLFPLAKNLEEVISQNKRPKWVHRTVDDLTEFWRQRWAIPRIGKNQEYLNFSGQEFVKEVSRDLKKFNKVCRSIK